MTRSPASGPPGTEIMLSGTGCLLDGRPAESVFVRLETALGETSEPYLVTSTIPVRADGTWSGTLRLSVEAPPARYVLSTTCQASDMSFGVVDSDFIVVAGEPPLPATTSTTTTTVPVTPVDTTPDVTVRPPLVRTG